MTTPPQVDPAVVHIPPYERSLGSEIGAVLDELGLAHQPWQDLALRHAMAVHDDNRWLCEDVALVVPSREDKQQLVFLRALIGASVLAERVLHVCETRLTADVVRADLLDLVESTPALSCMVSKVRRANGEQKIEFQGGGSVKIRGAGRDELRGESADVVIADNVLHLPGKFDDYIGPVVAASKNDQVWWVDTTPNSVRYAVLQRRALTVAAQPVLYLEWSARR